MAALFQIREAGFVSLTKTHYHEPYSHNCQQTITLYDWWDVVAEVLQ